jgi:hypothetical protein
MDGYVEAHVGGRLRKERAPEIWSAVRILVEVSQDKPAREARRVVVARQSLIEPACPVGYVFMMRL